MYLFCVYSNPDDYLNKYIVRVWTIDSGKTQATERVYIEDTLQELRRHKPSSMNVRVRRPNDDRAIIEYWI